jgi:phage baseplate assembly protein W
MLGMDARTGKRLEGDAHLAQSIGDLLSTPIGSRVMRRDYGSALFELVDQPGNTHTLVRLYAAVAMAIMRWEPRIRLRKVSLEAGETLGSWILNLAGERTDQLVANDYVNLTIPLRTGAAAPAFA